MRITGITSRILSYNVSAIYGEVGPPTEISPIYRYSFDTIHTDEGVDGHTIQFGWLGEGQAMGDALHQGYGSGRHCWTSPDDHRVEMIRTPDV